MKFATSTAFAAVALCVLAPAIAASGAKSSLRSPGAGSSVAIDSIAGLENLPKKQIAGTDDKLLMLTDALTDLLALSGHPEAESLLAEAAHPSGNNSDLAVIITKLLNETILPRMRSAHEHGLKEIQNASGALQLCLNNYALADPDILASGLLQVPMPTAASAYSQASDIHWSERPEVAYEACRKVEHEIGRKITACEKECDDIVQKIGETCTETTELCSTLECPVTLDYRAFLVGSKAYANSLKNKQVKNATHTCVDVVQVVTECHQRCGNITMPFNQSDIGACCVMRTAAEDAVCDKVKSKKEAWEIYDKCFDDALTFYETVGSEQVAEAIARMAQMRAILKIECLIGSLDAEDQATALETCIDTDYKQDPQVKAFQLVMAPARKLDAFKCPDALPGSTEYDEVHYAFLKNYSGLQPCPAVHCESACSVSNYHASYVEPEVVSPGEKMCVRSNIRTGRILYFFGTSDTPVNLFSASLMDGFGPGESLKVFVVRSMADDLENTPHIYCGEISATSTETECKLPGTHLLLQHSDLKKDFTICDLHIDDYWIDSDPAEGTNVKLNVTG